MRGLFAPLIDRQTPQPHRNASASERFNGMHAQADRTHTHSRKEAPLWAGAAYDTAERSYGLEPRAKDAPVACGVSHPGSADLPTSTNCRSSPTVCSSFTIIYSSGAATSTAVQVQQTQYRQRRQAVVGLSLKRNAGIGPFPSLSGEKKGGFRHLMPEVPHCSLGSPRESDTDITTHSFKISPPTPHPGCVYASAHATARSSTLAGR